MPLIDRDYTLKEATEAVAKKLPDEDAWSALLDALSFLGPKQVVKSYIVSEQSGTRWDLPSEAWASGEELSEENVRQRRLQALSVVGPRYDRKRSSDLQYDRETRRGQYRVRGLQEPFTVKGPIYIVRSALDALLKQIGASEPEDSATKPEDIKSKPLWVQERNAAMQKAAEAYWKRNRSATKEEVADYLVSNKYENLRGAGYYLTADSIQRIIRRPPGLAREKRR